MRSILKEIYHIPVVKKAIIDFVSILIPPPYRRDLMEFEFDVWSGISAMHCVDKRQLGESNTYPGFYRENTPTEYHKSNFEGSRGGLIINMTALHSVMNQWQPALILIGAIRHCYMKRFNITDKELSPADLFILAKICTALPAFLARRFVNPVLDGELSASVAAEYKITAGVFMVLRKMMENGTRWSEANRAISAEALYEYADKHNIFISSSGYACGGSKRKITELINFMIKGDAGDDGGLSWNLSSLADLVNDIDAFLDYSIQALTLEVLIVLCRSIVAKAFVDIDLNFLQDGEHKKLGDDYAGILSHIRRIFSADVNLECQVEVLYELLDKVGSGNFGRELKSQIAESDCRFSTEVARRMPQFPEKFRYSFAKAVGRYLQILGFLGCRSEALQNKIFATLAWAKIAKLSMLDVERRLNIVSRREIERISGVDMEDLYNKQLIEQSLVLVE